jgi:hypothetical protein
MASNPKMEYQVFLCIFQKNSAMATLGLKEMGKFQVGKKFCQVGCLSLVQFSFVRGHILYSQKKFRQKLE